MVIARAGSSPFYRQCFFQFLILGFSSDRPNIKNLKKNHVKAECISLMIPLDLNRENSDTQFLCS